MEENQYLKLRVQQINQRARVFLEKVESPYQCFPDGIQRKIASRIKEKCQTSKHYSRLPLDYKGWQVALILTDHHLSCMAVISLIRVPKSWDLTREHEKLYQDLLHKNDWQEVVRFISCAIDQLEIDFDEVLRDVTAEIDPDILDLSKSLRETRGKCQCLEKENKELRLAEGYIQQDNENLKSVIRQSIVRLQKVVQELKDTRSFLGRSKTIKGIREDVDGLISDLWPLVYTGFWGRAGRPWDGSGDPPQPRPPQRRAERGYNPPPDHVVRPDPPPHAPPRKIDPQL